MSYVSKYLAKVRSGGGTYLDKATYQHDERDFIGESGRYWGYINRPGLPFGAIEHLIFTNHEVLADLWFAMKDATHGKIGEYRHNARCYTDEAYALLGMVRRVASCLVADTKIAPGGKFKLSKATFI